MLIHKALLKYGYSGFKLEIIEYCNKDDLLNREQYYQDLLKPEYNIYPTKKPEAFQDINTQRKYGQIKAYC